MLGPRSAPGGRSERSAARRRSSALRHHLGMEGPPDWIVNVIFGVVALIIVAVLGCLAIAAISKIN